MANQLPSTKQRPRARSIIAVLLLLAAATILIVLAFARLPSGAKPETTHSQPQPARTAVSRVNAPSQPAAPEPVPPDKESARTEAPHSVWIELPKPGTRARHRPWVQSTYGKREDQLGFDYLGGGTMLYPPQGFVPTRDGKLIVVDSNKNRLVWYDASGRIERILPIPELVMPADVAITDDGTIAIVDYPGVQTKGLLLLDPDGTKRAEMPQLQSGDLSGLYAVGNDLYFDNTFDDFKSERVGSSDGTIDRKVSGAYSQDDDIVPGMVAPDGRTVVSAGFDDDEDPKGRIWVTAVRGEAPEHLFSGHYQWPTPSPAMYFVQSDAAGNIYLVLNENQTDYLLCLDPNGQPTGLVAIPNAPIQYDGNPLREYHVAPTGGLVVMKQLGRKGIRYDWYDCH